MLPDALVDRDIYGQSRKASSTALPPITHIILAALAIFNYADGYRDIIVRLKSVDRETRFVL
jgi:hypothetical protein